MVRVISVAAITVVIWNRRLRKQNEELRRSNAVLTQMLGANYKLSVYMFDLLDRNGIEWNEFDVIVFEDTLRELRGGSA